ncbi:MAG: prepilin-type N-terminal cleavage/methylation domain-containing protein [Clostridia bacterium]
MEQIRETKGFTLIEIIITLAIISLLLTVASPQISKLITSHELKSEARIIATRLRAIQLEAVTNKSMGGSMAFYEDSYWYKNNAFQSYTVHKLPKKISIVSCTFANRLLIFTGRGYCNAGHIKLKNSKGEALYVIISPYGRVRISDIKPN